jgi:hypothetical protein
MDKIYVVVYGFYDTVDILKAFASEEAAKDYILKSYNPSKNYTPKTLYIETVDFIN